MGKNVDNDIYNYIQLYKNTLLYIYTFDNDIYNHTLLIAINY